jgi:transposase
MRDTELYRVLLGLQAPWTVERVALDESARRVDVWVVHPDRQKFACPQCGNLLAVYDHTAERVWQHLDSCGFQTFLHARPPRVTCSEHGVVQSRLHWAEPNSRFTSEFESLAIDVLRETTVTGASAILSLSWEHSWHIMEKAVERGLQRKQAVPLEYLGIDEKAVAKGHQYMTIVCNIVTGAVEFVGEERKTETLNQFFSALSTEQLRGIRAIALDMWDPYIKSIRYHVSDSESKMVFDRFHVMKHIGKAVDDVRKEEHRQLMKDGNDSLKGSKYLWLHSYENLSADQSERFKDLQQMDLKTSRAWAIKENLRHLWDCTDFSEGKKYLQQWYNWATHSKLKPIVAAAKTIKDHAENILTFVYYRITNALSEGVNSKIQAIKQMARGYPNRGHFRAAIFFHCGKLDMYPEY